MLGKCRGQALKVAVALHQLVNRTGAIQLSIAKDTVKSACEIIDYICECKLALYNKFDENDLEADVSDEEMDSTEKVVPPPFKKKSSDSYDDTDLELIPSQKIMDEFPREVKKVLTFRPPIKNGSKVLFTHNIALQAKIAPARKNTDSFTHKREAHRHSAHRTHVFFWHLQRKGLGVVAKVYGKRGGGRCKKYFTKTPWEKLPTKLKAEVEALPMTQEEYECNETTGLTGSMKKVDLNESAEANMDGGSTPRISDESD